MLDVFNLTNPGNQFNFYTNPDDAFNQYDAVQVVARKRYARDWQLQGSYTWSKNRGTVGNRWHVNAARFDLGNPGRFVNPNSNINAYGRATFDPTHEVKVLGSYRLPWWGGTMVSGVYRYMTGQAWGRTASSRLYAGSATDPHRAAGHATARRPSTAWICGSRRRSASRKQGTHARPLLRRLQRVESGCARLGRDQRHHRRFRHPLRRAERVGRSAHAASRRAGDLLINTSRLVSIGGSYSKGDQVRYVTDPFLGDGVNVNLFHHRAACFLPPNGAIFMKLQ